MQQNAGEKSCDAFTVPFVATKSPLITVGDHIVCSPGGTDTDALTLAYSVLGSHNADGSNDGVEHGGRVQTYNRSCVREGA